MAAVGCVVLLLAGCAAASQAQVADAGASGPVVTAPSTPSPTVPPLPRPTRPPANSLTAERMVEIETQCPDQARPRELAALTQEQAAAVDFLTSTGQCDEVSHVIAEPDAPAFESPMQYIDPDCPRGDVLSFWAHFDDDLLFGSPALPQELDAGHCLRTFFATGSDAGRGPEYATSREAGIRVAYDQLRGRSGPWTDETVRLRSGLTVTATWPSDDRRITLFFLRLPDGGLDAGGFAATGYQSLPMLLDGTISVMTTIDTGAAVTRDQLVATALELVHAYRTIRVLAHLPGYAVGADGDHPDHQAIGTTIALAADADAELAAILDVAQGYGVRYRDWNIPDAELARKIAVFIAYAAYDPQIGCATPEACLARRSFGEWLPRQYLADYTAIQRR